jgi:hypothetical protein
MFIPIGENLWQLPFRIQVFAAFRKIELATGVTDRPQLHPPKARSRIHMNSIITCILEVIAFATTHFLW